MKNKETKKITKLETLSYILIIINLLLIFLVAYTYLNKQETPKEEKKISKVEDKKEEEITDEIRSLVNKYDVFNNQLESVNFFGYLYKEDEYKTKDISDNAKIYIAISNIQFVDNKELMDTNGNVSLPKEMMEEKIKELFGNNTEYKDQDLNNIDSDCRIAYFKYDNQEQKYKLKAYGHNTNAYSNKIKTNIEKVYTKDNKLEVYISMYVEINNKDGINIYKDTDLNDKIVTLKQGEVKDIFKDYSKKLQKYKYTFKKEEDRYIFSKIEKVIEEE